MSEDRHVHAVWVTGIDENRSNLLAIAQAEMGPVFPAVSGFVDAIAGREIRTPQSFATADINDVRIRRRKCQCTDRSGGLAIEDRSPRAPEVVALPDTPVVRRHNEEIWLARDSPLRAE